MTAGSDVVAFDVTALAVPRPTGVSHAIAQLLTALVAREDGLRYALLASRPLARLPPGTMGRVGPGFPNRSLWMQVVAPFILARLAPGVCHFTNSIAPLVSVCPTIVSVYDMSLFLYPATQPRKSLLAVRTILPGVVRRARAVIVPSESARGDLIRVLGVPGDNVHTVYMAAAPHYAPVADAATRDDLGRRHGIDGPYILTVGTLEPRKNLHRLVQAFARLRRGGRRELLVIVGQLGWKYRALLGEIDASGVRDAIRILGYVPDADMPGLYSLARAVAFPSLYEGFGLPIVEGMACGTPVLTSNRSSMAELAGEAALQVDPTDVAAIEAGLMRLLEDGALRERLIEAGRRRAAGLSWRRAASETVAIYEAVRRGVTPRRNPPPW